jgi:hypothetical protein
MDTGTKENNNNKTISFFENSENMDEKLGDFEEFLYQNSIVNNLENSYNSSCSNNELNATTSFNSDNELNFEKPVDISEIINNEKKQEVFRIKSSLMKRVEDVSYKLIVLKKK